MGLGDALTTLLAALIGAGGASFAALKAAERAAKTESERRADELAHDLEARRLEREFESRRQRSSDAREDIIGMLNVAAHCIAATADAGINSRAFEPGFKATESMLINAIEKVKDFYVARLEISNCSARVNDRIVDEIVTRFQGQMSVCIAEKDNLAFQARSAELNDIGGELAARLRELLELARLTP